MSRDKRPIAESPWRLEQSPGPDPAHVYAGVRLVAVVYDSDSAAQMVQQHNEQLARERRAQPQTEKDRTMTVNNATPARGQFRKKPVTVEAAQWFKNGDHPDDYKDAVDGPSLDSSKWISFDPGYQNEHGWEGQVVRYFRHPDVPGDKQCEHCRLPMHVHGWIDTLEGGHIVCPGDWIITGVKGEHYPCKPDVFAATYEPADTPTEQHRHFRSPEELADYLESLYEADSEGALAGGKWKYAQVAARAIRDTLAAERGEQHYGPVFVMLRETKGSPDEVFEEIETVGGRSVRVPSAKKGFRRQIGPLYTRETITALRDSRRLLGRDLRQARERNALLEKQLATAQHDTLVNLAARLEQTLSDAPIARAFGEAVVRYLRKEAGAIDAETLQKDGGPA